MDQVTRDRIELARRDPNDFVEFCFVDKRKRPLRQGRVHRRWQDAMDRHKHVLIEAPRDHGKTTQCIARAIWKLGRNPNTRIVVVACNDTKAGKRLSEIRQHVERNERVHMVFPNLEFEEASKTKLMLRRDFIAKDSSVEAYGVLSSGTGDRADIVIFDDVCDRRNSLTVQALRRQVKEAYRNDWMNLLREDDPDTESWYIFTPWHKDDLSHDLKAEGVIPLITDRVEVEWGDGNEAKYMKPVWSAGWPVQALRRRLRKIKKRAFQRGYCCDALDDTERLFNVERLSFGWPTFKLTEAIRIHTWDGAAPYNPYKRRKQRDKDSTDFVAHCDGYVSPLHASAFVADAWQDRNMRLREQTREVFRRAHDGPPPRYLLIEQQGESALASEVADWIETGKAHLPAETEFLPPPRRTESKFQRAEPQAGLVDDGVVMLAPHLHPEQAATVPLVEELSEFPFGEYDDLVDTFVDFLMLARRIVGLGDPDLDLPAPELESSVMIY